MPAAPRLLRLGTLRGPCGELPATRCEERTALLEHGEGLLGVAPQIPHRSGEIGAGSRQRLSVRRNLVLETRTVGGQRTLAHRRATDDERRPLRLGIRRRERPSDGVDVVTVDREDVPTPCLVFHRDVLGVHLVDLRRELNVVRIVIHDEVREPQMSRNAAHSLRNLLLDRTVRDVGVGLVRHPLAEACDHETLGNRSAQRHRVALSERSRGVLHTAQHVNLGMARRRTAPLAQRLQLLDGVVAGKRQRSVKHGRHVARIEEEPIAVGVVHACGIVAQEFGVEHRDEIGAAHSAAGVPRFRLFDHRGRQNTDVVGDTRNLGVRRHRYWDKFRSLYKYTNKPSAKANFICLFAEAEYIRRKPIIRISRAQKQILFAFLPRRSI